MAMRVELHRVNDAAHFEARNEERNSVSIGGAGAVGATFSADVEITWSLAIHPSGDA